MPAPTVITRSARYRRGGILSLKELEEKNLVQCLTPNRRKSKLFKINQEGEEIIKEIHEINTKYRGL